MEVISQLQLYLSYNLPGLWPIHLFPLHLILTDIEATIIYVCTDVSLERLSRVALREMCHCSHDNKVALCTKTNPLRPF